MASIPDQLHVRDLLPRGPSVMYVSDDGVVYELDRLPDGGWDNMPDRDAELCQALIEYANAGLSLRRRRRYEREQADLLGARTDRQEQPT